MKRLLLLRHAKAVPATDPLVDIDRPLAERGERDARRIGERLRQQQQHPALIVASPAARALRTAQLVAGTIDYPRDAIALDRRLYLAEPAAIIEIIAAQDAAIESLLVVGHNPGLTDLTHQLLPAFDVDDLPTCAIVGLDYADAASWRRIASDAATISYYDYPKNTRTPVTAR
ncbi:MAG TPA: histidine phosphatase family protein [Gammaproteobacteria bacterium]|nr:histidine phosphatase family protein [Gammaproteobacteria bacterium]